MTERLRTLFHRLIRFVGQLDALAAKELGLHATDFAAIGFLCESKDPVTPKRLSEHLGLTSGAATAAIDRLERAGYVVREADPADRRGVIVTPVAGRFDVVVERRALFRQYFSDHLDQFDLHELQTIERFLSGIGHKIELEGSPAGEKEMRPRGVL
ncbi:MarR family winged helix-turn-helix transcriptional regulator [Xanthobacter sediminis]